MDYRYGSHTVFQIEYHFVWVTKYRYKVLSGEVAVRVRELVRQTCEAFEIRIVRGVVSADHVHILVSAPPEMAPSEIDVGQLNVHQHQVGPARQRQRNAFFSGRGLECPVSLMLQDVAHQLLVLFVVFDDQNGAHLATSKRRRGCMNSNPARSRL
jgi:putative transposase